MALVAVLLILPAVPAAAQERLDVRTDGVPAALEDLRLDAPLSVTGQSLTLDSSLVGTTGEQKVIVRLRGDALAESHFYTDAAERAAKADLDDEQDDFVARARVAAPGVREIARVSNVLNAVFLEVDASYLAKLANDPAVTRIAPVANYELDLSETVPYIGAAAVQADGVDGSGITVAVLDSGVDYTHADLGGGGTLADYAAAYGAGPGDPLQTTRDGLFPTAKVVEGFDFVGEAWVPGLTEVPDPDPIDFEGHGTHVADIIAGVNGVAPGASILAVKVCSAISSSCSGIALIQGMDFAADPNGDGNTNDAVDIINMSLGSVYGQPFDDDLAVAVDNATALGILTVASAGNSADKPYIVGTPSAAPTALSVAQTQVPSAGLQLIDVAGGPTGVPAVFQPWSVAPGGVINGVLQYGDGVGGNLNGCAAFPAGSLAGLVVLVDRGACNFTLKIKNIGDAGGVVGIIGLVAPGAPFSGGDGGDAPITIPGYMIDQADSNAMKAAANGVNTATVDPANSLPLIGQMVGSSSRGPSNFYQEIKPEIGAPGASVSAIVGTGTGTGPFGGTSGAAPMVSGAAALLLDAYSGESDDDDDGGNGLIPAVTKAILMNTGETNIDIDPFSGLAEITRLGGGEVRADRAVASPAAAWDNDTLQGALSFGMHEVDGKLKLTKTVRIQNLTHLQGGEGDDDDDDGGRRLRYTVIPTFRYQNDIDTDAVSVKVSPRRVNLKPGQSKTVRVTLTIDPSKLPGNFMNSGSVGADGSTLSINEFDGYLLFDERRTPGQDNLHMAWQVLPRQAANTTSDIASIPAGGGTATLANTGAGIAQVDGYSLIAVDPDDPRGAQGAQSPTPDLKAVGVQTFPVPAGFCSASPSFLWVFALQTWDEQSHLIPVSHQVNLDTDQDGIDDYVVLNRDVSFNAASDGRQLAWVFDLSTGGATAFFFAEHATNTGNTALTICGEQIGLSGPDILATNVDGDVFSQDFYFGGPGDSSSGFTITPLGEQYLALTSDVPAGSSAAVPILDFGPFPGNSPELGLMLFTNGDRGAGARGGATDATDTIYIGAPGADLSDLIPAPDPDPPGDDDDDDDDDDD